LIAVDAVNHLPDNSLPAGDPPPNSDNPAGLLFYARLRQSPPPSTADAKPAVLDFASDDSWIVPVRSRRAGTASFAPKDWSPAVKTGDIGMLPWRESKVISRKSWLPLIRAKSAQPWLARPAHVALVGRIASRSLHPPERGHYPRSH